jgi:hypothetical protein
LSLEVLNESVKLRVSLGVAIKATPYSCLVGFQVLLFTLCPPKWSSRIYIPVDGISFADRHTVPAAADTSPIFVSSTRTTNLEVSKNSNSTGLTGGFCTSFVEIIFYICSVIGVVAIPISLSRMISM